MSGLEAVAAAIHSLAKAVRRVATEIARARRPVQEEEPEETGLGDWSPEELARQGFVRDMVPPILPWWGTAEQFPWSVYIYINIKYVYVYTYGSLFGPYHVINMYKSKGKFRGQEWTHLMAPSKVLALWDAVPRLIEGKDAAANASHTASWKILEAQVSLAIWNIGASFSENRYWIHWSATKKSIVRLLGSKPRSEAVPWCLRPWSKKGFDSPACADQILGVVGIVYSLWADAFRFLGRSACWTCDFSLPAGLKCWWYIYILSSPSCWGANTGSAMVHSLPSSISTP